MKTVVHSRTAAWLELLLRGVPTSALAALLRAFGGPEQLLAASRSAVERVAPTTADRLSARVDPQVCERSLAWLAQPGCELLTWDDDDFPKQLFELPDAPPALFFIGQRSVLNRPSLAIVGSRHATPDGCRTAHDFARSLSGAGLTIVSGLALGIDGAAHEGALEAAGSTIAVIATGPDRVYPPRHRELARAIAGKGALLSELPPGTPPLPHHFPRRNRLISGLALGVLVVEAAPSSGSLVTARLAAEQGRDVFAIPGSIHSPLSKGPHKLIREGAKLVETAQDVLNELRLPLRAPAPTERPPSGPSPHDALLRAMGRAPVAIDQIASRSALGAEAIAAALIELELEGRVAAVPGGRWQRVA